MVIMILGTSSGGDISCMYDSIVPKNCTIDGDIVLGGCDYLNSVKLTVEGTVNGTIRRGPLQEQCVLSQVIVKGGAKVEEIKNVHVADIAGIVGNVEVTDFLKLRWGFEIFGQGNSERRLYLL